jgi:autotransporter-associated beta strand protein
MGALCVMVGVLGAVPGVLGNVMTNGEFTGSLEGWTMEGAVFNTGNQAVFSDSVATPTGVFQTVGVGEEFAGFEISFDALTGGLSPTVPASFLADSFYATVYLGAAVFGPTISAGVFEESVDLLSQDASGFFGVAAGATFGPSSKGVGWTRYTLRSATAGLFEGAGFLTVAFQFFDLNGVSSDSTAAVDNVVVTVLSAPLRWALASGGAWEVAGAEHWRLLSGGVGRAFTNGVPVVFDGGGGEIVIEAAGVVPGGVTVTVGGYVFAGGAIRGEGRLMKSGVGLLVLEGANAYEGGTVIEGDGTGESGLDCFCAGGVLEALFCGGQGSAGHPGSALWVMNAAASATGSGAVQIGARGMLGGVGRVTGAVTAVGSSAGKARVVPGGIAAPIGPEVLRLAGGLTVGAEAELVLRLGEQGFTGLAVTGDVQVQAGARVRVVLEGRYVPQAGAVFDLIAVTGGGIALADPAALILPVGIDWESEDFATQGVLRVRGQALALEILKQPEAQTVRPGEEATFAVVGMGTGPVMYQWQKDGAELPGEVRSSLSLSAVGAGDEGDYRCVVFNGVGSVTSDAVALHVRDFPKIVSVSADVMAELGDEVTFQVTVAGPGPFGFVWEKDEADLPGGPDADTVTITSVALADAGHYRVRVSNAFGSVTSAAMLLRFPAVGTVANAVPEVTHVGDLPAGRIGVAYSFSIPMRQDDADGQIQRQPSKFTCSGLPSGLKCNALTGEISGVPLVSRVLPYQVTMVASNKRGKSSIRSALWVAPMAPGMVGTFAGPVERDVAINAGLGGSLQVKVAASGAVSGVHVEGSKRRSFRSVVAVSPASVTRGSVAAEIKRGRNVTPHQLTCTIDAVSGRLMDGAVTDGLAAVSVAAWRNPWSKTNPATALGGYYTASIGWRAPSDLADDSLPQGFGFVAVTITPRTGGARLSGRLMDGSPLTGSTFAGPNGQMLIFRTLYASKVRGSLLGMMVATPKLLNADNTLEGCVGWNRPENLAKSNRLFRSGFSERFLDVVGARYTPPAKDVRILGLTDVNSRGLLSFARAGIESALPVQGDTPFALSNKNKAVFDKSTNLRLIAFSVVPKTGLFKGRLTLKASNPVLLPGREVVVTRRISYQGILIGKEAEGVGYALVPQLPQISGETPANTPILGAGVLLQPAPPF